MRRLQETTYPLTPETCLIDSQFFKSAHFLSELCSKVPHERLEWGVARRHGVQVFLRRDDLIHPQIGGNKLYKLWGHLYHYYKQDNQGPIASFGGAYSNHLYALACVGQLLGIETVGIVRGERPSTFSPTLRDLQSFGMQLHFISRLAYSRKHDAHFCESLQNSLALPKHVFWIPEGGGGAAGLVGCRVLGQELSNFDANYCIMACGTGTTMAGVAEGLQGSTRTTDLPTLGGISALSANDEHFQCLRSVMRSERNALNWFVSNQYHCGGFARSNHQLREFMSDFQTETTVVLDRVYTGKMMLGIKAMIESKLFRSGDRICAIHSGGLQGNRNLNE